MGNLSFADLRSWVMLASLCLAVSGCAVSSDPETRVTKIFTDRGYGIVADGRGSNSVTSLEYIGTSRGVLLCSNDGKKFNIRSQDKIVEFPNENFYAKQSGTLSAFVVVYNDGRANGLFLNALEREIIDRDGAVIGTEFEAMEFPLGKTGSFQSGPVCKPRL